ncbi:MAG: universal stress protein [Nitrospinota bacterium]
MYGRVLIPLDGSEAAEAAVKEAVRLAPAIRSAHLLVVDEPIRGAARLDGYVMFVDEWFRVRRGMAADYARPLAEKLQEAGVEVTHSMLFGEAGAAIVQAAQNLKPDLILLGGEEGGWFRRPTGLASLAARVSRRVSAAVLTVQEGALPAPAPEAVEAPEAKAA